MSEYIKSFAKAVTNVVDVTKNVITKNNNQINPTLTPIQNIPTLPIQTPSTSNIPALPIQTPSTSNIPTLPIQTPVIKLEKFNNNIMLIGYSKKEYHEYK